MLDDPPLLEVKSVSKRFCRETALSLRYGVLDLARAVLPGGQREAVLRCGEFWSVDNVSFAVNRGEAVAIGGRNGAGKTTLLRMLAGLLKPDRGHFRVNGTVNSVIELGQGLNPQLSGRENSELGLAWRGMTRNEIRRFVAAVEDFAALGDMFDTPVHSYSAGMRVRLAFSIAVSIPCDLLLLDEVLAVGDLAFQRKCIDHMRGHLNRGGALILVSHNPVQMQAICRRGILLDRGQLAFDGSIEGCIDQMIELQEEGVSVGTEFAGAQQQGTIDAVIVRAGDGGTEIACGDAVEIEIAFRLVEPLPTGCEFSIWTRDLSQCIAIFVRPGAIYAQGSSYVSRCTVPELPLAHGTYSVRVSLFHPETHLCIATKGYSDPPAQFAVRENLSRTAVLMRQMQQLVRIDHYWHDAQEGNGLARLASPDSLGDANQHGKGPAA